MEMIHEEPEKIQLNLNEFEVARSEFFAHTRARFYLQRWKGRSEHCLCASAPGSGLRAVADQSAEA